MKNIIEELYLLDGERSFPEERKHFAESPFNPNTYEQLVATLNEEQKKLLETLCQEIDGGWAQESQMFYHMGVKTGFALAQELL